MDNIIHTTSRRVLSTLYAYPYTRTVRLYYYAYMMDRHKHQVVDQVAQVTAH